MHVLQIYTIYDSKAETYNTPFLMLNDAVAVRSFQELLTDPMTTIQKNPEDYTLFHIGEFNGLTGQVKPIEAHIALGNGIALMPKPLVKEIEQDEISND